MQTRRRTSRKPKDAAKKLEEDEGEVTIIVIYQVLYAVETVEYAFEWSKLKEVVSKAVEKTRSAGKAIRKEKPEDTVTSQRSL